MQDQIYALNFKFGIPATSLNSQQTPAQTSAVLQELRYLQHVGSNFGFYFLHKLLDLHNLVSFAWSMHLTAIYPI